MSPTRKTDFKANASGSFKIGVYNVDARRHFGKDQGVESSNSKRDQRESVFKSARNIATTPHGSHDRLPAGKTRPLATANCAIQTTN